MYAITGITGKVGGALARQLLAQDFPVRAVVRDAQKAKEWAARGCEIAFAGMNDASALAAAFEGASGVFILPPPEFDPTPGFPEAREVINAVKAALEWARPQRVVCLSTIGAQAAQTNLLTQRTLMERALSALDIPVTFLRPAWFMENYAWDIVQARQQGLLSSFLQPLDKPVPMVAAGDVGRVAAGLLTEEWSGRRVVELESTLRVTPHAAAAVFANVLGRPVDAEIVARDSWEALFRAQGMRHPEPRMRMIDGFNEGWIEFEQAGSVVRGETLLAAVLRELVVR